MKIFLDSSRRQGSHEAGGRSCVGETMSMVSLGIQLMGVASGPGLLQLMLTVHLSIVSNSHSFERRLCRSWPGEVAIR